MAIFKEFLFQFATVKAKILTKMNSSNLQNVAVYSSKTHIEHPPLTLFNSIPLTIETISIPILKISCAKKILIILNFKISQLKLNFAMHKFKCSIPKVDLTIPPQAFAIPPLKCSIVRHTLTMPQQRIPCPQ